MRLDKYLKVSRLIKRRTVANEVADAGRILINGKTAKATSFATVRRLMSRETFRYLSKRMILLLPCTAEPTGSRPTGPFSSRSDLTGTPVAPPLGELARKRLRGLQKSRRA